MTKYFEWADSKPWPLQFIIHFEVLLLMHYIVWTLLLTFLTVSNNGSELMGKLHEVIIMTSCFTAGVLSMITTMMFHRDKDDDSKPKEVKYIITEKQLKTLLVHCPDCGSCLTTMKCNKCSKEFKVVEKPEWESY